MTHKLNAATLAIAAVLITACSHKDNANQPATATSPSASAILAANPADLAVDHAGNVVTSAPAPSSKPAVSASPASLTTAVTLPFIGKKSFNFDGGEQTVTLITIKSDGTVILKEPSGGEGIDQKFAVSFQGKFTNPIQRKDGTGLLFKDGKVFRLVNGNVDHSCNDVQSGQDNIACSSELDNVE